METEELEALEAQRLDFMRTEDARPDLSISRRQFEPGSTLAFAWTCLEHRFTYLGIANWDQAFSEWQAHRRSAHD